MMRKRKRKRAWLLAVCCAVVAAATSAAAAPANRLQVGLRTPRLAWSELSFDGTVFELPVEITCSMTLLLEFTSTTFAKSAGTPVGALLPQSILVTCRGAPATLLVESLPWGVSYQSFQGRLPTVTQVSFSVTGFAFNFRLFEFIDCLYRFPAGAPGTLRVGVAGGTATSAAFDEAAPLTLATAEELCPSELSVSGSGSVRGPRGEAVAITLV